MSEVLVQAFEVSAFGPRIPAVGVGPSGAGGPCTVALGMLSCMYFKKPSELFACCTRLGDLMELGYGI